MIIADAHVHIYDCFDPTLFLDYAETNFSCHAQTISPGKKFHSFLLLSETTQINWFQRLAAYADKEHELGRWRFLHTDEKISLQAERADNFCIYLVAGRQIVTAEKLEVLALFTDRKFKNGVSLVKLIKDINRCGAMAVIPWGTGKWLGKRGQFLKKLIVNEAELNFFLGDNGGRPFFWPEPVHFKIARQKKISILRGSDPLPLAAESRRAGSFGFYLQGTLSEETPAKDLKKLLTSRIKDIKDYGKFQGGLRFFLNQLLLRLPGR